MKKLLGNIEKHGVGFRATVMINGERIRETFHTKGEAERFLAETRAGIERAGADGVLKAMRTTLAEVMFGYAAQLNPEDSADKRSKRSSLMYTLDKLGLSGTPIGRVKTSDIKAIVNARAANGITPSGKLLSPSTINKDLSFISSAFGYAQITLGIDGLTNPVIKQLRHKLPPVRVQRVPESDLELIRQVAREYEAHPSACTPISSIIEFAILTCCRLGEICALRWEHISYDGRSIELPPEHDKARKGRQILLNQLARDLISVELARKREGTIFETSPESVRTAWNRVIERAGVPHYNFHMLRHEACSRLAEGGALAGMSEAEMRLVSGHNTPAMFARYVHLNVNSTVDKLDQLYKRNKKP